MEFSHVVEKLCRVSQDQAAALLDTLGAENIRDLCIVLEEEDLLSASLAAAFKPVQKRKLLFIYRAVRREPGLTNQTLEDDETIQEFALLCDHVMADVGTEAGASQAVNSETGGETGSGPAAAPPQTPPMTRPDADLVPSGQPNLSDLDALVPVPSAQPLAGVDEHAGLDAEDGTTDNTGDATPGATGARPDTNKLQILPETAPEDVLEDTDAATRWLSIMEAKLGLIGDSDPGRQYSYLRLCTAGTDLEEAFLSGAPGDPRATWHSIKAFLTMVEEDAYTLRRKILDARFGPESTSMSAYVVGVHRLYRLLAAREGKWEDESLRVTVLLNNIGHDAYRATVDALLAQSVSEWGKVVKVLRQKERSLRQDHSNVWSFARRDGPTRPPRNAPPTAGGTAGGSGVPPSRAAPRDGSKKRRDLTPLAKPETRTCAVPECLTPFTIELVEHLTHTRCATCHAERRKQGRQSQSGN